ncbi:MAG: nucleotidyl transferase AbiEii/AbiGii toxin family protein [Acidobacteria bacterium]|nr:nucleotidyl transferase AbiEii/AbiGii toxin family protein [Acidobacteriota bacterium]
MKSVAFHLRKRNVEFALVGGIAVSLRTIERFTKDVDFAISVASESEAESIVDSLRSVGFRIAMFLEKEEDGRLMTVRLKSGDEVEIYVDLLFATSGIEKEVVEGATGLEVFPGFVDRLATVPALIAMKVLSADWKTRPQDIIDLQNLFEVVSPEDIAESRRLLDLITERGYNRDKDLQKDLDGYLEQFNN